MSKPHVLRRLESTKENAMKVADVLVDAFVDDPVISAFLEPISDAARRLRFRQQKWFQTMCMAAILNKGELYEVNDFEGASVWMPPNTDVGNPFTMIQAGLPTVAWELGIRGLARLLGPGQSACEELKKQKGVKGPGSDGYWYCFFVGVCSSHQGKGLSRPLMSPHTPQPPGSAYATLYPLSPTHTTHHPIWLESTTIRSRTVYEKLGYERVGEVVIAKGSVDDKGGRAKGEAATGVRMWALYVPAVE